MLWIGIFQISREERGCDRRSWVEVERVDNCLFYLETTTKFRGSICAMSSDGATSEEHHHSVRDMNYTDDFKGLISLYVNAFEDQIQYTNVSLATGEEHRDLLRSMFSVRLSLLEQMHDERSIAVTVVNKDEIIGAGIITPNSCKVSSWYWLLSGVYLLPFRIGLFAFIRALKLGGSTSETEIDPSGGKLAMMAVDPSLHGQGIGGEILKNLLERWETDMNGGDLILLTQLESSVKFYRHYGFVVSAEVKKDGYSNYSMIRRRSKVGSDTVAAEPVPEPVLMADESSHKGTEAKAVALAEADIAIK